MRSAITKNSLGPTCANERRCKKTRTEESAKVGTGLPTLDYIFPDNSLSAEEKALEYKEIAKNTNRLLKYARSWRDNVASYIQGLESFFDGYDDLSDEQQLHIDKRIEAEFNECIQKAKDLKLENDMKMEEQIPLKTFLLKLKNFVNGFVSLFPIMVALAETMDKVLEEGVTKNGVIVDAGKLVIDQLILRLRISKGLILIILKFIGNGYFGKKITGIYEENLRNFVDGECSDVTLVVNDEKFHVAKLYLSTHSSYFKTMFLGGFEESKKSEIELSGGDADELQKYLEALYGEDVIDEMTVEGILRLADMYDTKLLVQKCGKLLLENSTKTLKKKLEMAVKHDLYDLKNKYLSGIKTIEDIRSVVPGCISQMDSSLTAILLEKVLELV